MPLIDRHTLAVLGSVAALLAAGCPPGDPPADDAGTAGGAEVAVGTGGIGLYVPLVDGDTALMARGCQGGQHVWIGVRARGLDTEPALVSLSGIRVRDGAMISIPVTVRLRFVQNVEDGWDEITGIQLIVPIAEQAIDEEIDIFARVAEDTRGGQTIQAQRRVTVIWGDEVCGGALGDGGAPEGADGGIAMGPDAGTATDAGDTGATDGGTLDAAL
jgi:hypothetical protein